MKDYLRSMVYLTIIETSLSLNFQALLNLDYCLRRTRNEFNLTLENVEEFFIHAESLLSQGQGGLSSFFIFYKQLAIALNEPFFSVKGLRFSKEMEEFLWSIPVKAEVLMQKYEDYLSHNFENVFPGIAIPFPQEYLSSIWRGQLEFAQNLEEFKENAIQSLNWVAKFKGGELDKISCWKEMPKFAIRMLFDLAKAEKGIPFIVKERFLKENFEVLGGKRLLRFLNLFEDFFDLQKGLFLLPKNFYEWEKYIILRRETAADMDPRIISENIMNPFIQRHFCWEAAKEKGIDNLYIFVRGKNFFSKYEFLNQNGLSFLYYGHRNKEGKVELSSIRKKLETLPTTIEGWSELLDRGVRIYWDEVDDSFKVRLIEVRTAEYPLTVGSYQISQAGLYGLYKHYGMSMERLREEVIIPQLAERAIDKFIVGELIWPDLDIRVAKQAQREILLRACSALGFRLSEFLSSEDNFMVSVPELGNKNLASILNYWGSTSSMVEGLKLKDRLRSQYESRVYQLYATYWSIILVAQLAKELGCLHPEADFSIENLHKLAWDASFGYQRLENVVEIMAKEIVNEKNYNSLAAKVIGGILNYLSHNKLVVVIGVDARNKILFRLQERIIWIQRVLQKEKAQRVLQKEKAVERLLLEQLKKRLHSQPR